MLSTVVFVTKHLN